MEQIVNYLFMVATPSCVGNILVRGKSCNDRVNFDTFKKLGMAEDNHLRIGESMGDKFENQ